MSIRHDSRSSDFVNSENYPLNSDQNHPTQHTSKIRGHWIPIEIWDLAENEVINWTELRLLLHVESLVNAKGIGCWASLSHFSEKLRISPNRVSSLISHLRDLKLLHQIGTVTVRNLKYNLLETAWSRIFHEGETAEECEKRLEKLLKNESKLPVKVSIDTEIYTRLKEKREKRKATLTENDKGRVTENDKHTKTPNKKEDSVEGRECESDARSARPVSARPDSEIISKTSEEKTSGETNGHTKTDKNSKDINSSKGSPQSSRSARLPRKQGDPVKELTTWFHAELVRLRLNDPKTKSLKGWVAEIRELIEKTIMPELSLDLIAAISYLKDLLVDHLANASNDYQPKAFCAAKVHKRYRDLVAARKRRQGKNGNASNASKPKKSDFFNKFTGQWFQNLPEEYDHPDDPKKTVKVYPDGGWSISWVVKKDGKRIEKSEIGLASEGDYPPLPRQ